MKRLLLLILLLIVNFLSFSQEKKSDSTATKNRKFKKYVRLAEKYHTKFRFKKASKYYFKAIKVTSNADSIDWLKEQIILNNKLKLTGKKFLLKKKSKDLNERDSLQLVKNKIALKYISKNIQKYMLTSIDYQKFEAAYEYTKLIDTSSFKIYNSKRFKKFSNDLAFQLIKKAAKNHAFHYAYIKIDSIKSNLSVDSKALIELKGTIHRREEYLKKSIQQYIEQYPNYAKSPEIELKDSLQILDSMYISKVVKELNQKKITKIPFHLSFITGVEFLMPSFKSSSGTPINTVSNFNSPYYGIELSLGRYSSRVRYALSIRNLNQKFSTYYSDEISGKNIRLETFDLRAYGFGFTLYVNPFIYKVTNPKLLLSFGGEYQKYNTINYSTFGNQKENINKFILDQSTNAQIGINLVKNISKYLAVQVYLKYSYRLNQFFDKNKIQSIDNISDFLQNGTNSYGLNATNSSLNSITSGIIISLF